MTVKPSWSKAFSMSALERDEAAAALEGMVDDKSRSIPRPMDRASSALAGA